MPLSADLLGVRLRRPATLRDVEGIVARNQTSRTMSPLRQRRPGSGPRRYRALLGKLRLSRPLQIRPRCRSFQDCPDRLNPLGRYFGMPVCAPGLSASMGEALSRRYRLREICEGDPEIFDKVRRLLEPNVQTHDPPRIIARRPFQPRIRHGQAMRPSPTPPDTEHLQ